jgi:hypothetical protein
VQPYTALLDGLIEVCEQEGRSVFLLHSQVWHGLLHKPCSSTGDLLITPDADADGALVTPPPPDRIPWLLPRAAEVLRWYEQDTDAQLFAELTAYHESISELPTPAAYDLLAAWTMHTYLLEHCDYSPILYLWGAPEHGKTRTGRGIAYVAYRGLHIESLREACLTRIARDFRATLFIDVHDLARKAKRERADDTLLQRFEKRAIVPRVLRPLRGPHEDMEYLPVFGATVIATNEPPDEDLRTRCLVLPTTCGTACLSSCASFDTPVTPEPALPLRERLLAFRARHITEPLPQASKPATGRLGDIIRPLLQVVRLASPDREPALLAALSALHHERPETPEAALLRCLASLRDRVEKGHLSVKAITTALNEGRPHNMRVSTTWVGKRLAALGFAKSRVPKGAVVLWEEERLQRTMAAYGVQDHAQPT